MKRIKYIHVFINLGCNKDADCIVNYWDKPIGLRIKQGDINSATKTIRVEGLLEKKDIACCLLKICSILTEKHVAHSASPNGFTDVIFLEGGFIGGEYLIGYTPG